MAASGVVEAFKRLSTSDERAAALEAIIKELNPYEWREAFARLKRRTFQCDLVSSLPIEIGIQIFRYLDISTPFRLQSVSKNWRRLLTSPDILRPMLSTWYSDLDRPLEGEASLRGQDYAVCQLKAEHMHRFRRGAPFSWVRINLSEQEPWNMRSTMPRHPAKVDFIDETVAWLDNTPESSLVKVCNLRTKKSLIVGGEGRERIHYIKLTTELISFTTFSGRIYACDLATGERRSFRLPSARSPIFSCRGRTIGGTIWEAQTSEESTVFIWNFDTCKCQTFQIENPRPYHPPWGTAHRLPPQAVLLNPMSQTILICSNDVCPTGSTIRLARYSFTGDKIREICSPTSDLVTFEPRFEAVDQLGHFMLCLKFLIAGSTSSEFVQGYVNLEFDERTDSFGSKPPVLQTEPTGRHVYWKDTTYSFVCSKRSDQMALDCLGTCAAPTRKSLFNPESSQARSSQSGQSFLFLNDTYVVLFGYDTLEIWSFDKNIQLPEAELQELHES